MTGLLDRMVERGGRLGRRRAQVLAGLLAERLEEEMPGISAEAGDGQVVVTGRGLERRWLTDERLRFVGELLR